MTFAYFDRLSHLLRLVIPYGLMDPVAYLCSVLAEHDVTDHRQPPRVKPRPSASRAISLSRKSVARTSRSRRA